MTDGSNKSDQTQTGDATNQTYGTGSSLKTSTTEALAELVEQLDRCREESAELDRLLKAAELDPVAALTTANNLRQVSQIIAIADRVLTMERVKIDGLALLALHRSKPDGSA